MVLVELYGVYASPMLGSFGAIYRLLIAFGFLHPNAQLSLMFVPVLIAAKYFIPGLLLALPLHNRKSKLQPSDFWQYLAIERLALTPALIDQTKRKFVQACRRWPQRIEARFLSAEMKARYLVLLGERFQRLGLW